MKVRKVVFKVLLPPKMEGASPRISTLHSLETDRYYEVGNLAAHPKFAVLIAVDGVIQHEGTTYVYGSPTYYPNELTHEPTRQKGRQAAAGLAVKK